MNKANEWAEWKKCQAMGQVRFTLYYGVLRFGLMWGAFMAVLTMFGVLPSQDLLPSAAAWFLLYGPLAGLFFGSFIWWYGERGYRRSLAGNRSATELLGGIDPAPSSESRAIPNTKSRSKVTLVAFAFALLSIRGVLLAAAFDLHEHIQEEAIRFILMCALAVFVVRRHQWARLIMAILSSLSFGFLVSRDIPMAFTPEIFSNWLAVLLCMACATYVFVIIYLLFSRDVDAYFRQKDVEHTTVAPENETAKGG